MSIPFEIPAWLEQSKYLLIFFMVMFEGAVTTIAGGFLLRLGQVDFLPLYVAAVTGDLVADIGWYYVGYHGAGRFLRKYGHYVGITPEATARAEQLFHKYHVKILFFSKITMGMGFWFVTLLTAGMLKIPLRIYAAVNLAGGLIWIGMLITIGYLFGNAYERVLGPYKFLFVVAGLITVISVMHIAQRKLKSMALQD